MCYFSIISSMYFVSCDRITVHNLQFRSNDKQICYTSQWQGLCAIPAIQTKIDVNRRCSYYILYTDPSSVDTLVWKSHTNADGEVCNMYLFSYFIFHFLWIRFLVYLKRFEFFKLFDCLNGQWTSMFVCLYYQYCT